ncbi:type IV secretory system conjugative DNA transfer family protein [Natronoglycomyces albus]|uniref:TraM recognition domain-containing protein n=1 Tax=Natronoglycomyces albus TaxID=2811108 RepID=A0A895XU35_9ACTN|nr:type IV secretory system conjugative DNA transfer family protein [Natronoglycomyces albus]QSB07182.1 TraM recognition domain-containing protein [Natronoglycomyces albus]
MSRHMSQPGVLVGLGSIILLAAAAVVLLVVRLLDLPGYDGSLNPFVVITAVATGTIIWTTSASVVLASLVAALIAVPAAILWWRMYRGGPRRRSDAASRHMAGRSELKRFSARGVAASAKKLRPGLESKESDEHGVFVAYRVPDGMKLFQSWEDMAVDIWGPRKGKTTARAIPAAVAAPGPLLVTSRKGDIVDATRGPREEKGRVWVFDPMAMLDQEQAFWWNPLAPISSVTDARRLAAAFTFSGDGTRDEYFASKSDDLVANFILAAAVGGKTLVDVFAWTTRPRDDEPAQLLESAGYIDPARAVRGAIGLPDKTRGGVYGGAEKAMAILTETATSAWITPTSGVPQFDPEAFVSSTDTLYLLSEDGPGAPAPLVAAFVDSIYRAGEVAARRSPGRRLNPPLLSVLDEAANICKIKNLPNLYSFYGSAGMPIITILQSFVQGVGVWGREGMQALWSAANIRVLGGGVSDAEFLENQSKLIGEFDEATHSHSSSTGSSSRSTSMRRRRILEPSDLTALPDGRVVVLPSGARPVLARTRAWWDSPWAEAIERSQQKWDPLGTSTPSDSWDNGQHENSHAASVDRAWEANLAATKGSAIR